MELSVVGFRTQHFGCWRIGSSPVVPTQIIIYTIIILLNMAKYDWSKDRLENAVKISTSYSETLRNLEIPT